jgi:hypothetical protein
MLAQSKTHSRKGASSTSFLLQLGSAYAQKLSRFWDALQRMKATLLHGIDAQAQAVDTRAHDQPYFWIELYNAALLEADTRQVPKRIQYALRAVEQRRGALQLGRMDNAEWNLLQYAELVLSHMGKTSAPFLWCRQPHASGAMEEKKPA